MQDRISNKKMIVNALVDILYDAIRDCDDENDKQRIEICQEGLKFFNITDEEIIKKFFMFNKSIPDEEIPVFIEKNKEEINKLKNEKIRNSLYWLANNLDVIK